MNKNIITIIFFAGILIGTQACKHDKDEPNNTNTCDTANVTYTNTAKAIFDAKCAGCHAVDPYNFNSYELFRAVAVNGKMNDRINRHVDSVGVMPPKTATALTDCEKQKLNAWISQGAKN